MEYNEMFKTVLSMFALDASDGESSIKNLEPTTIQDLFIKVMEANKLCQDEFRIRPKVTSF